MTHWLRQNGYHTRRAGIRANVGCSEEACARLEARLEGFAEHDGPEGLDRRPEPRRRLRPRARGAAARTSSRASSRSAPPTVSQLRIHPLVLAQVGLVSALGTARVPGLFSWRCLRGDCCERFRDAITGPFPDDVGYVAMYSRSDGIVDWHSCLDPAAELVEVGASHCGMSVSAQVYRELGFALGAFARRRRRLGPGRLAA